LPDGGGADVKRFLDGDVASNMEMIAVSQAAFRRMADAKAVFIAHISGHALGGGLEIALACDVRLATAAIKRCVHEGGRLPLDEGLALEAELIEELFGSEDAREGLHAFVEKRNPEFVGG
jgi:enoyl-CoA hydratase/carnithine racemase